MLANVGRDSQAGCCESCINLISFFRPITAVAASQPVHCTKLAHVLGRLHGKQQRLGTSSLLPLLRIDLSVKQ